MTQFADLTNFTYEIPEYYLKTMEYLNVGWLGEGKDFKEGLIDAESKAAIERACASRPKMMHMGVHLCEVCPSTTAVTGTGVYFLEHNGRKYAFPRMLYHYVDVHSYLPPTEFLDAIRVTYP